MNGRFLMREMVHGRSQVVVFILCVALSLISIVAINSFRRDVRQSVVSDARGLHGGDIIVHSHYPFSPSLEKELISIQQQKGIDGVRSWEFYSVARRKDGKGSVFSNIKAVAKGYPLYGQVDLRSGRALSQVLQPGKVVVAEPLLDRLGLVVGDQLLLGRGDFEIADVVVRESARPVDFFNFGPRILVSSDDLERMDLVQKGSRVQYETLLRVSDARNIDSIVDDLKEKSLLEQERVATFATEGSRLKRFFDNLFFFLSLISVFTLLLAGIGMQSALAALFRRKERSIAILRSLGATGGFLLSHYLLLVIILSLIGTILGIVGGFAIEKGFIVLFAGLLPAYIVPGGSVGDVLEGLILSIVVVSFFTFLPLARMKTVKPMAVFRKEESQADGSVGRYLFVLCGMVLLAGLVVRQLEDVRNGLYFIAGIVSLVLVVSLLAGALLKLLSSVPIRILSLRQAARSMLRPGNSSQAIIVTLASALAVLLAIYLLEQNLRSTYIASYPPDAPNLFCLDIQQHQQQGFRDLVGRDVELFPIVRARLTAINDKKINRRVEVQKRGDSLAREFNLTYRGNLLDDEVLIAGEKLFGRDHEEKTMVPVSILDSVADMGNMELGDILYFNIQGVPLISKVVSIRSRTKSMLYPFFYFVFPESVLKSAPQTFFGALKVEKRDIAQLENKIVNKFPNISTINVAETAAELGQLMEKLTKIINFFAAFSLLAGGLILISSILATRMARIKEAVYYKILGAGGWFVMRVFFFENVLLALLSGCCAILVAQTGSWALCHFLFKLDYNPHIFACLTMLAVTVCLVVVLGMLSSMTIIRRKPITFLRDNS
ncbi:MAG: ABC transporter permease [Desulforhopalus sp.]